MENPAIFKNGKPWKCHENVEANGVDFWLDFWPETVMGFPTKSFTKVKIQ